MGGGADFRVDVEDEAIRGALVLLEGELMWPPPVRSAPPPKVAEAPQPTEPPEEEPTPPDPGEVAESPAEGSLLGSLGWLVAAIGLTAIGAYANADFIAHFTVFILACFIGWQVIWNVAPALHTPLMAVTNAISGIIIVGGILQASTGELSLAVWLGVVAILVASINVFGGFLVTQRMLKMFRK